ncbi:protein jag [Caldibacillus thermolactis]|uniref:RNA-binding protein KhpB n=1 Tax=Pallidibacillus thermolactis TaxID=251051 RepID=A0ABT2WDW9_9BACI|nr:RNA-binding cell elongation regulator Jag/EloR [Pallidibacillus thermolactis]MCU9593869.1 protein jag [Pallidibacillus thermolactis]MCU9602286.1 protein jag [Pallidibacillus thermolactis subsp. kokeshiiformis]MED1673711.1 RNA-binding cell elongation regulator Jag/EloR [Pallidibacillus thermolactis subsp. kokeshiiformis]
MKEITATGQTVNEAIESALKELHITKNQASISIVDEGKKGILGIFGSRPAIVKVKVNIDPIEEAKAFLKTVCANMDIPIEIESTIEGNNVRFNLNSEKTGLLIGKRGQTLNALQSLTQLVLNRYTDKFMILVLDIENYRKRREESLTQLANRLASKAIREQREIKLEPMPSFERKIIHSALAENEKVKTFSIGTEPNRRLVIQPK